VKWFASPKNRKSVPKSEEEFNKQIAGFDRAFQIDKLNVSGKI
jgi:hypothetical protein